MIDNPELILPIITWPCDPDWSEVEALCKGWITEDGIRRLSHALGNHAKTVVVELHYIDRDYRDTFSHYHSRRFSTPDSRCIRLHFFDRVVSRNELRTANDSMQTAYLGYSVLRPTRPNCVGRTLLRPVGAHLVGAYVCTCKEHVHLQGVRLQIEGFPFISQDTDVTVCAQSALWMALRYFSDRYSSYAELHPYEVNELTRDYSVGRLFPTVGLYTWQLAEVFRKARFAPVIYDRDPYNSDLFDHLLYTYIESGIPILVAFDDHVVVGFGHISDLNPTMPSETGLLYSSSFNKAIVVHDDNCYPAEKLPRAKTGIDGESEYDYSKIRSFVVPLPERVHLAAECFGTVVNCLLSESVYRYSAISPLLSSRQIVLRCLLTTVRSFKRKLAERRMGHPDVAEMYQNLPMPHFIWVCEISDVDLYRGEQKVWGEVIWDATRNVHETDGWIALHYPERLFVDVGSALNEPQNIKIISLTDSEPYVMYTSNLKLIE